MNILSINKFYWLKGGSETVFFSEKKLLEEAGHLVVPFCMKDTKNESSEYSKYFVENISYEKVSKPRALINASKIIYSFEAKKKMDLLLENYSPDIAHFHIFQHQISPSVFASLRKKAIPIVLTLHDLKPLCPIYTMYRDDAVCEDCKGKKYINCLKNKCTKGSFVGSLTNTIEMYFHNFMKYYQQVDYFIAVSNFYRNKMIEYGFPSEKIVYIPNSIKVNDYLPGEDKRYILYFGRLSVEKGIDDILKVAARKKYLKFKIVGDGPLRKMLIERIRAENLTNVELVGHKSGLVLKRIISESTCVVVPSKWYENCPMTVLEAYASGKPVVGSNMGGIPELINNAVDGFVYSAGDVNVLAECLEKLWEDTELAVKMGLAGRSKVEMNYNEEKHCKSLVSLYEKAKL